MIATTLAAAVVVSTLAGTTGGDVNPPPAGALRAYRVSGMSCAPAVVTGDVVVVDTHAFREGRPDRGDLVQVRLGSRPTPLLKRVVGLPGELFVLTPSGPIVSDVPLFESWMRTPRDWSRGFQVLRAQLARHGGRIPDDHVVLLGDGDGSRLDSRELGLFSTKQLLGKVVAIRHREDSNSPHDAAPSRVSIEETVSSGATMSLSVAGGTPPPTPVD